MQQGLGFETGGVNAVRIALPGFRYNTGQKEMEFYLRAEAALRRLPGVGAVAISDSVPPGGWESGMRGSVLVAEGQPNSPFASGDTVANRKITPDYFRALNIPILRGRSFQEDDRSSGASGAVVISRLLAERLFPNTDAVGKQILNRADKSRFMVIGVAQDAKNGGLMDPEQPEIYFLRRNTPDDWGGHAPVMIVSSVLPEKTIAPWVRAQIAAIDPTVPVEIETMTDTVSSLANRPRFETALLGFFAFCGLLMAVIGLYGVISFVAAQRTQEIGVRMALGATRGNILRLIMGEGLRLIVAGGVLGLTASFASARLLKSLLFDVAPHDPLVYTLVALLLALVALVATLIPARAAMKVEPVVALRYE